MKFNISYLLLTVLFIAISCKQKEERQVERKPGNSITYAKGFELYDYDEFSVLKVTRAWPGMNGEFTYVLKKQAVQVPDSLSGFQQIQVPIARMVATSTTHLPALELLEEVHTLVGFPQLELVSSKLVRERINKHEVVEVGKNEQLNTEQLLDIQPEVVVAFAMDGNNPVLETLAQSGIQIVYNGDWAEETPLGKAEWIKLFGALYDKKEQAEEVFQSIATAYHSTLEKVKKSAARPTVMSGAMYEDVWYLPEGNSWAAMYFKDAQADYFWKETRGTGSLALSLEAVMDRAQEAEYWINPAQYESLGQLEQANPHYGRFKAFKDKKVFSFSNTKGETGGVLFYELGLTRPDLVLKDLVSILHPEIFPDYERVFYQQLQ